MFDPHFIHVAKAASEAVAVDASSGGAIGTLGINLKLFLAQLVNVGIALVILWKWVFTPVAKKLQERTERIEKSLKDAKNIDQEKQDFAKWKEIEMTKVRSQATAIVAAAESQASKAKQQILEQAKQEQAKVVEQTKQQVDQEKLRAVQEAKSELADLVTVTAEKIIRQKLDSKKDEELIKEMLKSI